MNNTTSDRRPGRGRALWGIAAAGVALSLGGCLEGEVETTDGGIGEGGIGTSSQALTFLCTDESYDGHDYKFCSGLKNWSSARGYCQARDMDLVRIESAAEDQWVQQRTWGNSWLGGTDTGHEGDWRWSAGDDTFFQGGSVQAGYYANWNWLEPNNFFNEDCVVQEKFAGWNDAPCGTVGNWVCESVDDLCPDDDAKTQPGECGCGVEDYIGCPPPPEDACGGCTPSSDPCTQTFCDEVTATCLTASADGSTCDDGDPGTTDDICIAGGCVGVVAGAPDPDEICDSDEAYAYSLRNDPNAAAAAQQAARDIRAETEQMRNEPFASARTGLVRVPVVVHVVGDTSVQNKITDAVIQQQLDHLNEAYAGDENDGDDTVPADFASRKADMDLEFVLAERSPTCQATTGIVRQTTSAGKQFCVKTSNCPGQEDDITFSGTSTDGSPTEGSDIWDPERYVNIYVAEIDSRLLGRATLPWTTDRVQAVLMSEDAFGTVASAPYDQGDTLVHEMGHYFGLYHTFHREDYNTPSCEGTGAAGDACESNGDEVCDTPALDTSTSGCPSDVTTLPNSCTDEPDDEDDMTMNYMDYTQDACMYMFTNGQKERLSAALENGRRGLRNSAGLVPPPGDPSPDLWMGDGNDDVGDEPNTQTSKLWRSDDIWVRATSVHTDEDETVQTHENPEYLGEGTRTGTDSIHNHVFVAVRNRGCQPSEPTYVRMNWAKASTNLGWPGPWDGSVTATNADGVEVVMGGESDGYLDKNYREVPSLAEGEYDIERFEWYVPNPADYAGISSNDSHFCLLATIDPCSSDNFEDCEMEVTDSPAHRACIASACEDAGEGFSPPLVVDELSQNVRNHNNLAWKNVSVVADDAAGNRTATVTVSGDASGTARFAFEEADADPGDSVFNWGSVVVDLGADLFNRWLSAGEQGNGVSQVAGTSSVRLEYSGASLEGIPLASGEYFPVRVTFVPDPASDQSELLTYPKAYYLDMEQFSGSQSLGGQQFMLRTLRPSPASCGNGVVEGAEACDDANTQSGDYCSDDCQAVTGYCGDGQVQSNEVCDPPGSTCTSDCQSIILI